MIDKKYIDTSSEKLFEEYVALKERGQHQKAIASLEKSAKLGAIYAIYTLAYEYDTSNPPNDQEAVRLYKKAIRLGDVLSAWNLAKHYEIRHNTRWYLYWMQKASEMGMQEATDELSG